MEPSISFFELQLKGGELLGVLGSGGCNDVLARELPEPNVRICMKDPDVVDFRVRMGTAEVTEEGLKYGDWDTFQSRGASLRLFAWSIPVARWLSENEDAVRVVLHRNDVTWLEYDRDGVSGIDGEVAKQVLRTSSPEESRVLIKVQVPRMHVDELLTLLRQQGLAEPY